MIHTARPTVQPVAITIFTCLKFVLFYEILKSGDGRTTWVKIVITTGSALWIKKLWFSYNSRLFLFFQITEKLQDALQYFDNC